jgi:hypothetical protein
LLGYVQYERFWYYPYTGACILHTEHISNRKFSDEKGPWTMKGGGRGE